MQVIEARALSLPAGAGHGGHVHLGNPFGGGGGGNAGFDAYAIASVVFEAGAAAAQTRVERGAAAPRWEEALSFPDVALSARAHTVRLRTAPPARAPAARPGAFHSFLDDISQASNFLSCSQRGHARCPDPRRQFGRRRLGDDPVRMTPVIFL